MRPIFLFLLIPFCLEAQIDHWETAVYASDTWSYRLGTSEPPSNWNENNFNDNSWQSGTGGIGYGDYDDGTEIIPVESVYIRNQFEVFDKNKIEQAILHADFDDGFVAYLNGQEIARINVDGEPPSHDTWAFQLHEASLYQGNLPDLFEIDDIQSLLIDGENTLAIQVHNFDGTASSDMSSNFFLSFGIIDSSMDYGATPGCFMPPLPPIENFTSNLPIIKINTNGVYIPAEPSIAGEMGIIWNGAGNINASSGEPTEFLGNIAIDRRGQSSLFFPKNGYAVETKDENGEDMDVSFLNFPEEEDWILHGPYSDKTLMRNVLAMHLGNEMGSYNSRTRYVELIINEEYEGIYVLMEKIKRDKNRVDIATLNPEDTEGDELTGGYVFKIDKDEPDWYSQYDIVLSDNKIGFQHVSPKASKIVPEQANYIESYIDSFENALIAPDYTYGGKRYDEYIDVQSFIDHFLLKELAKDVDAYRISSYYYKEKDSKGGKLFAGPAWDFNIALGNANYCNGGDPQGWMIYINCDIGNPFWWQRFLQDDLFKQQLYCRWRELRQGAFSREAIYAFIDEKVELLEPSIGRNFQRWPVLQEYVWPNVNIFNTYPAEITYLKDFLSDRLNWMDAAIGWANCATSVSNTLINNLNISPNPFDNEVFISFELNNKSTVSIEIIDVMGRQIHTLEKQHLPAGKYQEILSLKELGAGIYFCKIEMEGNIQTVKLVK